VNKQKNRRFQEIWEELRLVMRGREKILDSLIPPILFLILNTTVGFDYALWGSLGIALVIGIFRAVRRQSLVYAFSGVGGVLVAVLIARFLGRSEGFFLPGLITGSLTVAICFFSLIARRPLAAWTSRLTRRWPPDWYWHPKVRPAYSEVTLAWLVFFSLRLLLQLQLFQRNATQTLGWVQLLSGWPALILVLIGSYIYGIWRLGNLNGPSVDEFLNNAEPPWEGQKRGF
jgi:hypothetical protein